MKEMLSSLPILPILLVVLAIILLAVLMSGYVKASPDQAIIISGLRKTPRELIGRAGIKVPFLEKKDILTLELIPIDVKTSSAVPTADYININVDAAVNVQIGRSKESIEKASKNFLNKKAQVISQIAREVLEGNMREIIGQMKLEEMVTDRQKFANLVKENAEPDLAAMGLDIVSFNVQNFIDNDHVIENLGVDNIVKISKAAAISRAESEKEIAAAQSKADKEKNDARVEADLEIAKKRNELELSKADLKIKEDTARAKADAAYKIQEQEQRKTVEIATTDADIAKQEKEAELQRQLADVREQALNAEVRKQADADKYKREKEAEASLIEKQKEAEAATYAAQQRAEARRAEAEASLYEKQKEAEGIEAVGKAQASAIQAQGIAEAEAMEKKAEAYAKYNNAAVIEMMVKILPEMAGKIAEPLKSIDKVNIYGGGDGSGISGVSGNMPVIMKQVFDTMSEATGVDFSEIMKAQTYDAKVTKNLNVSAVLPDVSPDEEISM